MTDTLLHHYSFMDIRNSSLSRVLIMRSWMVFIASIDVISPIY